MNTFDTTSGTGISSLLNGPQDQNMPGAFDAVQRIEPNQMGANVGQNDYQTGAQPPAAPPQNQPYFNNMVVNSLYQQILGRAPTEAELQSQGDLLNTGGKSFVDIASNLYSYLSPQTSTPYSAPAPTAPPTTPTFTSAPATPMQVFPIQTEETRAPVRASGDAGFLPPEQRSAWLNTLEPNVRDTFLEAQPNYLSGAEPSAQPATGSPEWFKQYIYQGGANDAEATRRGIDWVTQQGMRPQDAVNLWNQSLGTKFNVTDLFNQTGGGPEMVNFGDDNSWTTGAKAFEDKDTGMIRSEGAYFQRGNDAIVSDELFWNPNSPTGQSLADKVKNTQDQGQRAGVVITPYAVFQDKATNDQLLNEVKNSGADFVALDPYLGWGVPADKLYEWTKEFIPQLNALGKEVKLVTQGFARKGEEDTAHSYNQKLLNLPGISEFINFGLEDWYPEGSEEAKKLFGPDSEWTVLNNDFGRDKETKRTIGKPGAEGRDSGRVAKATQTRSERDYQMQEMAGGGTASEPYNDILRLLKSLK